jgi:hypothetical protein
LKKGGIAPHERRHEIAEFRPGVKGSITDREPASTIVGVAAVAGKPD